MFERRSNCIEHKQLRIELAENAEENFGCGNVCYIDDIHRESKRKLYGETGKRRAELRFQEGEKKKVREEQEQNGYELKGLKN